MCGIVAFRGLEPALPALLDLPHPPFVAGGVTAPSANDVVRAGG